MAKLKKPANPVDIEDHREAKAEMKAFEHEFVTARRWHHQAIVSLDACRAMMKDELNSAVIGERADIIERYRGELRVYFRPTDEFVSSALST